MASYWNVKLTSGAQLNCSRGKDGVYLGGFDANNAPDLLFTVDFDDAANGWVRLVNPKSYRLTSPIYIYLGNADNNASKFKIQVKDNDLQKYSQMRDKTIANGIAYGNNNIAKNVISTTKTTSKKSTKDTFNTKKNKTKKKTNKVKKKTDKIKKIKNSSISSKFDKNLKKYANSAKYAQIIKNGHRIFGAPYRFMSHVDYQPQIDGVGNVGREYMDNILLEAPIVHFVPGLPAYLTDFTKRDKETLEQYMATQTKSDADGGVSNNVLKKITDMEGRYFNFSPNYAEYIRYVNLLCSSCAIFMGLGNTIVPGTKGKNGEGGIKYPDFNWANYENIKPIGKKEIIQKAKAAKKDTDNKKKKNSKKSKKTTKKNIKKTTKNPNNKKAKPKTKPKAKPPKSTLKDNMFAATAKKIYKDLFGDYHFLKLYVDPNVSFGESISNGTSQSVFEGLFDNMENVVRELNFLSRGDTGPIVGATTKIQSEVARLTEQGGVSSTGGMKRLLGLTSDVMKGSNIIFPELWSDSSYSRSYSFGVTLNTPYGNLESIFIDVIAPLMHILALASPRQASANAFNSPFLVKVFAKGWFSCELGVIDSLSIDKVNENYNVNGLPNEIKVNFSVKDLYGSLMIPNTSQPGRFFNNHGLIEFLQVTCGMDILHPEITTKIHTLISVYKRSFFDIPANIREEFIGMARSEIQKVISLTK